MKRKIAICFLLVANIVLLAHAVLPHHHHCDGTVCFFFHSCHEGSSDNKACNHKGYEECSLVNVFIQQQTGHDQLKHDLPSQVLSFIIPVNPTDLRQNAAFAYGQMPLLKSKYLSVELRTCGLRAPPISLS